MGTRNLTCVMHEGKYKVAQYGQWDGYPSGQGKIALDFLRGMDREEFIKRLNGCYYGTPAQLKAIDGPDWAKQFPYLSRDAGADVLNMIAASKAGLMLTDQLAFAADSLFCEWAYVIDFDKNTFEVYKGFNKTPLPPEARFAGVKAESDTPKGYTPVRMAASWPMDALPTDEEFLKSGEEAEETTEGNYLESVGEQMANLVNK
jgi:hypothetical protein